MRTSADIPYNVKKYSTTEMLPCPRCGSTDIYPEGNWWGFDEKGRDINRDRDKGAKGRGVGCRCSDCDFGFAGEFMPQIFYAKEEAIRAWNLVADTTTRQEANEAARWDDAGKFDGVDRVKEYARLKK